MTIKNLYTKFRHLILYGIIGCCSSGLDFVLFTLLVKYVSSSSDKWYLVANVFSTICGICLSFFLNWKINYKTKDKTLRRFVTFFAVGISGMMLSEIILYCTIDILQWNELVSKLLSIVIVVLCQFLFNNFITFKKSQTNER